MPVESATYIDELDPNWPLGSDNFSEGDDHLRLIKQVLQDSFTNATYPIDLQTVGSPTGSIILFGADTAPDGYLNCNGGTVSRTTFSALYDAIGTTWGAGDGSTTFGLPDLRDRVPAGYSATHALASTGGKDDWVADDLPAHGHTTSTNGAHTHQVGIGGSSAFNNEPPYSYAYKEDTPIDEYLTAISNGSHVHTVNNTGSGGDNRQKTIYMHYIIKT